MDLRCFVAIELSDELRENISGLTRGLRASEAKVRWVPGENLHLTLKFLGNTPERLLPGIRDGLAGAASGSWPFTLAFRGTGVFPDLRRPRVVWVGAEDTGALLRLQGDIEKTMEPLGYAPENRAFRAHLTIGRVKSPGGMEGLKRELDALGETEFGTMRVGAFSLMKSVLRPQGALYERLFSIALQG
jgi:2'-5' RNA ligase